MDVNIIGNSANVHGASDAAKPVIYSPASVTAVATSPATPAGTSSSVTQPTAEQAKKAVDAINESLSANGNAQNVQFAVDPSSKRVVIQVIDKQTNTVIRQVPSEEIVQMSMTLDKKLGQVINQQA